MKTLLCTILLCCLPVLSFAEEIQDIEWKDLIPAQYQTVDPVAALSQEEQDEAEWIIYLRMNLPKVITDREQEFYDEMVATMPKLKEKGIDVDKIIAERQVRETSLNMELNGKRVRLDGYLLPLELTGKEIREFLLVPYVGACIHVPPPPPNQIVHGVSAKPIKYKMNDMFKPITVTGRLTAKSGSKNLFLGDGTGNVDIGYVMEVEAVEEYTQQ
ncbi:MAG: DUF3299 domain-containing protein [Candidatus Electrothrix aestuarii]|uniref:DUF3299 domain-containing protein n=1 Tax=Candidatus Electrothrix aestuarii TaxID=3062594 RepID=A0AAU8LZM5_9BACT|nr:DUF3299 domain-containing protein [Candidatus Electrothrix aestuarii]